MFPVPSVVPLSVEAPLSRQDDTRTEDSPVRPVLRRRGQVRLGWDPRYGSHDLYKNVLMGTDDESSPEAKRRPSRLLKFLFSLPGWFYKAGLGWMLGRRILALTHRGRKSGREYETVLETISFDRKTKESVVVSAYGPGADWFQNIQAEPASRIRTGRLDYTPQQRLLTQQEVEAFATRFCSDHPWEAKLVPKVLPAIGAAIPGESDLSSTELLASLPMVAFRPKTDLEVVADLRPQTDP